MVYNADINADAIIQRLIAQKTIPSEMLMTTSPCKWGLIPEYKDWWDGPLSDQILRGMLILDVAALDKIKTQDLQLAAKGIQDL